MHTRGVPLADDVDLEQLARTTPGMTGADLANLVNEAALLAAKRGQRRCARRLRRRAGEDPARYGPHRRDPGGRAQPHGLPRSGPRAARHAPAGRRPGQEDLDHPARPGARRHALHARHDRYAYDEKYLRDRIVGALGGMAAEQVVYGVVTTGSENDLEQVTDDRPRHGRPLGHVRRIGPLTILPAADGQPTAAPDTLAAVDEEVRRIVDECYEVALRVLAENRERLDAIVAALLEHETLGEAEAYAAAGLPRVSSRPLPPEAPPGPPPRVRSRPEADPGLWPGSVVLALASGPGVGPDLGPGHWFWSWPWFWPWLWFSLWFWFWYWS